VQGVGDVGERLAEQLAEAGARVLVSDIDAGRAGAVAERIGGEIVDPGIALETECDVYAPCALGATLNATSIPNLRCRIVAGAANNQLETSADADRLREAGILYAPDYVINGGGVINVYGELHRWPAERSLKKAGEIYDTLLRIFEIARTDRIPTYRAADRLAEQRIAALAGLDRMWMGGRR
jgi:leucine dehydrogenase